MKYISEDEREEKLLANQQVIKTPIVRNGKHATVEDGFALIEAFNVFKDR